MYRRRHADGAHLIAAFYIQIHRSNLPDRMTYNSLQRHCHCVFRPVQPYMHYYHIRHIRNQYMNESLFKLNLIWLTQSRTARRGTQTHTHAMNRKKRKNANAI